jgi:hypothetical protein
MSMDMDEQPFRKMEGFPRAETEAYRDGGWTNGSGSRNNDERGGKTQRLGL